jgi:hypothetical protein
VEKAGMSGDFRLHLRLAAPGIILASLLLLPFLNRPFTIDDPLYLRAAEHVLRDPLNPASFELIWNTGDRQLLSQFWLGGTLPAYVLAPVAALGSREWVAHLYQWIFLCAFLVACVRIARRLGCDRRQANTVGLLVASNPVTLAMSATCMPDLMAATFGAFGLDRVLAFREQRTPAAGVAAGVLLAAAVLCRATTLAMVLAAALLLVPAGWRRAAESLWPVAIALGLAALLVGHRDIAGAFSALTAMRNVPRNLVGFLCFQALTGSLLLYWLLSARWRFAACAAALVAAGILLARLPSPNLAQYAVPAAFGLCFLAACIFLVRDLRYAMPLVIWLCAGLVALPYVQMAAKYLLPGVPAAALLIVLHAARVRQEHYPLTVALMVAAGWISGTAIILGDTALANSQREAVRRLVEPAISTGRTVWAGGQWAFLGYAEIAGARALANQPPLPQPGDVVVISRLDYFGRFAALPVARDLVQTHPDSRCGFFVLNRKLAAGFYASRFGYRPFAFGCAELNRYDVYRVR